MWISTPDNDFVVGAMVTHQVGSVGKSSWFAPAA